GGVPAGAHLDADEQSAYAENALPAPARAYYAAHLTDCDDCRRSVTRLALAAGMPAQLEARQTATGQTVSPGIMWRERFRALFAPRAWRYAVPALALLLVGVVSLIVLTQRTQREGGETSIARSNPPNAQRAQTSQQPETHHAPQNGNAAPAAAPGVESVPPDSNASQAREEMAANSPPLESARPSVVAPLNDGAAPPPPAPSSAGSGVSARAITELPTPAPTPVTATDVVTITSDQEAQVKSGETAPELQKLEQRPGNFENRQYENRQREQVSGPRRNERARNTQRAADTDDSRDRADTRGGSVAATTAAPAPPAPAAAKRSRQREADRNRDENPPAEVSERSAGMRTGSAAETRTIAGRKFRRQGSAWVDTAYSAGQSYTVVRRNSEQFRALVADEPELRRVAGALGGEVTVVWKGRAYRIR
ncbi:MAG TPA: hypothetical protein VIQ24_11200, partial [Pyrinomonadaceae bacterium]